MVGSGSERWGGFPPGIQGQGGAGTGTAAGTEAGADVANIAMWVGEARCAKGKLRHAEAGVLYSRPARITPVLVRQPRAQTPCPSPPGRGEHPRVGVEPSLGRFGWGGAPLKLGGPQHGLGARAGFTGLGERCCPHARHPVTTPYRPESWRGDPWASAARAFLGGGKEVG